jgi:hypothetical protein
MIQPSTEKQIAPQQKETPKANPNAASVLVPVDGKGDYTAAGQ